MNRGLNTSMMIGTVFGWVWIYVALNNAPSIPTWIRFIVTAIAILLWGWIVFIRRKSRQTVGEKSAETSMFQKRSYFLIVLGEVFLILLTAFILQRANLQMFIPSVIAVVVALHFVLLGWSIRIRYLQTLGWIMIAVVIICNAIFTPTSRPTANHLAVGFGIGIVLWASVVISMARATRVMNDSP